MKKIKASEALRALADDSDMSMRAISASIGRAPNYLVQTLSRRGDVMLSTVASVASVTGHVIQIADASTGEVIATITPPPISERRR